jgi:ribosomal protein S18 acetylase RimI-like enzyme
VPLPLHLNLLADDARGWKAALMTPEQMNLEQIEAYYDTVPRIAATTEEVGPFTLFLSVPGTGWHFYARPRLRLTHDFTAEDVRRVLARQDELGVTRAIEWVHDVTPTLLPAVRSALGNDVEVEECPLLVLPSDRSLAGEDPPGTHRVLAADDPDLGLAVGAIHASFDGSDEYAARDTGKRPGLIESGHLITIGSYDDSGRLVGGGSTSPRGEVTELMGIGVLPMARKQGRGGSITRALVTAARSRGVTTAFLSAASDHAASVYRAVGFERVGTACILEIPEPEEDRG